MAFFNEHSFSQEGVRVVIELYAVWQFTCTEGRLLLRQKATLKAQEIGVKRKTDFA